MPRLRSVRDSLRHGLFAQRVLDRLRGLGLYINPYLLFREGDGAPTAPQSRLASEFPTSVLDPAELPEIASHSWATQEQLEERVRNGHLCIVGRHRGAVAGYTWADPHEVNDASCELQLAPGEAYLYDAFVVPDHRGRGLASYLRQESYQHLRRAGFDTFYSISDYFNSPALRFKQKLGAETVRLYIEVQIGGRRLGQWERELR